MIGKTNITGVILKHPSSNMAEFIWDLFSSQLLQITVEQREEDCRFVE